MVYHIHNITGFIILTSHLQVSRAILCEKTFLLLYAKHFSPAVQHFLINFKQGYSEVRYDEEKKRVVYEPLQLTQAFRYVAS